MRKGLFLALVFSLVTIGSLLLPAVCLARAGDLLVIHSTSGNSPNVLRAAQAARDAGVQVLAFSARDGGALKALADHSVIVPTDRTDRAQELHLCIEHIICDLVEREL